MKKIYLSLILVLIVVLTAVLGCGDNQPKVLDWEKTVEKQGVKVGDEITVDGLVFDVVSYSLKVESGALWVAQKWGSDLMLKAYNPHETDHHPNAPIGVVVLRIFNPTHSEAMKTLRAIYPNTSKEFPDGKWHVISVTGRVTGLNRVKTPKTKDGTPSIALRAVQIDVYDVEVIDANHKPFPDLLE